LQAKANRQGIGVMSKIYVLDACAIIASLKNEEGTDKVEAIFIAQKKSNDIKVVMHKVNLLEVYYDVIKRCGEIVAKNVFSEIKKNPIIAVISYLLGEFRLLRTLHAIIRIILRNRLCFFDFFNPLEKAGMKL
jgi:hypothetical protein